MTYRSDFRTLLRSRLDRGRFVGLPLTILAAAFVLLLVAFADVLEDVVNSDPIVVFDTWVAALLAAHRDPALTKLFLWLTLLGKGQVVFVVAVAACVIFLLWRRQHLLAPLLVTLGGQEATVQLVKRLVDRVRPGPDIAYYVETSFSFPSGHAAHAAALYGLLAYALARNAATRGRRTGFVLVGLTAILAVGLSRVYLGVHFPSDVLGGYLVGLLWLVVGWALAEALHPSRLAPAASSPAASAERIALTVAAVTAAVTFYVAMAVRYAPPRAPAPSLGVLGAAPAG